MISDIVRSVLIALGIGAVALVIAGCQRRCPGCGKWFGQYPVRKDDREEWDGTKIVTERLPVKDRHGKDTGQYVEQKREVATRYKAYRMRYGCRRCPCTWHGPRVTEEV